MKKTKGVLLSLLALSLIVLFTVSGFGMVKDAPAQILNLQGNARTAFLMQQEIPTKSFAPVAEEFLNSFNLYAENSTELDLLVKYSHLLQFKSVAKVKPYLNEIMSYMERINKNPELDASFFDVLPLWPEFNVTTYGNILAYLFPLEKNPLTFAQENNFVPAGVKVDEYMSRKDFLNLLGKVFMPEKSDALTVLENLGFIESRKLWSLETKNGFLLVDAIRLILSMRELIERQQISESKSAYEQKIIDLPQSSLSLNEKSLEVVLKSLQAERGDSRKVSKKVRDALIKQFRPEFGRDLTSSDIENIRLAFYKRLSASSMPAVYELPETQFVGDCSNELFRKTYMGPFVKTGVNGAMISCDNVIIQLPKNSYILNLYSLPKISAFPAVKNGAMILRSDAMKSFENTLIVGASGEELVKVIYHPGELAQLVGKVFGYSVADHQNNQIINGSLKYSETGAELKIHLRSFTGDNLVYFDPYLE